MCAQFVPGFFPLHQVGAAMTKGVFSRHFHETREGNYITKKGWVVWRIEKPIAEQLLVQQRVAIGDYIDDAVWPIVQRSLSPHLTIWESNSARVRVSETKGSRLRELKMVLQQELEFKWRIALKLPAAGELLNLLPKGCGFALAGTRLGATHLENGHTAQVEPSNEKYVVDVFGEWPGTIDVSRWTCGTPGLNADGTVFAWRMSEWCRQTSANQLSWGEEVFIISQRQERLDLWLNSREHVGELTGLWKVDYLKLPKVPDQSIKVAVFELFHITVRDAPPTVKLVSPYAEIDESGEPIFEPESRVVVMIQGFRIGSEFLIELFHEVDREQVRDDDHSAWHDSFDGTVACIEVGNLVTGSYELVVRGDGRASVSFRVRAISGRQLSTALEVKIGDRTIGGLVGGTHKVRVSRTKTNNLQVGISAPREVRWQWSRGVRTSWTPAKTETASSYLTEELREFAVSDLEHSQLHIDAGAYGSVSILLEREQPGNLESQPIHLSRKDFYRRRWMESLLGPACPQVIGRTEREGTSPNATRLAPHMRYLEKRSK